MAPELESITMPRLALAPFRADADTGRILESLRKGLEIGTEPFLEFLGAQSLGPLWFDVLHRHGVLETAPKGFQDQLKHRRQHSAVLYLTQQHALKRIDGAFEVASVGYAVFKGVQVRELVYEDPSVRPASDIDILVARSQRDVAARTLVDLGFELYPCAENVSHEATFYDRGASVDLHWCIMRPGRSRVDVTEAFLARRRREGFFWGLDHSDTLFTLLVHPAFAKYVNSPDALLCRLVDLNLWVQNPNLDWDRTLSLLDQAGLKVAAWAVLHWASELMGPMGPPEIMKGLEPGPLRARYLRYWMEGNLPSRWRQYPLIIQIAFTLALHDAPSGAWKAILGWLLHKWRMGKEQKTLLDVVRLGRPGKQFDE